VFCPYRSAEKIGVKTNFLHLLDRELPGIKESIHLGLGVTGEPYGELEKEYALSRHSITMLMERRKPVQIFTRSPLILRDADLLKKYSRLGLLAVSVGLCTADPSLAEMWEPGVPAPDERFKLLRELRRHGVFAGVSLSPIVPYITDYTEHIEDLFMKTREARGEYILPSVLSFEDAAARERVLAFTSKNYPKIHHRLENIYDNDTLPAITYTERVSDILKALSGKHGIPLYLPTESDIPLDTDIRQGVLR
jgi:DNA repair photolyase